MSKKVIRAVRDLPEWFDIGNYAETKHFTLEDWACRFAGLAAKFFAGDFLEHADDLKNRRRVTPLEVMSGTLEIPRLIDFHISRTSPDLINDEWFSSNLGTVVPYRESTGTEIERKKREILRGAYLWQAFDVDLKASDEQIMQDFKLLLKRCRAEQKHKFKATPRHKNYSWKDARAWYQAGVLPYLELVLWARIEKVTITQYVLGRAIFPDDFAGDPTERVRRTTKPKAEEIMHVDNLSALRAQIESARLNSPT